MGFKQQVKSLAIRAAERIGPHLPTAGTRRWLWHRGVAPLMDPAVLPKGLVARPLKNMPVVVPCDPYTFVHRNGYWCGVFFEEELEAYLRRELASGDTVIDVGTNVGHVALPAGWLVRPHGQVIAFEPNGELAAIVAKFAADQDLPVRVFAHGLGETQQSFTLRMEPGQPGMATMRADVPDSFSQRLDCVVKVGDEVMPELRGRVFLKIDVEGLELQVLRGMPRTLGRVDHAVIEVSPEFVGADGVAALLDLMAAHGLVAHHLDEDGRVGRRVTAGDITAQINVVFRRDL